LGTPSSTRSFKREENGTLNGVPGRKFDKYFSIGAACMLMLIIKHGRIFGLVNFGEKGTQKP
jgi:hypothetical protein